MSVDLGDPNEFFTAEAVRRDGFGMTPRFEAWIAELAGEAIGYALVVPAAYETGYAKAGVYVQDLFVAPEARRCGAARSLLAAVAADTRARGLEFIWLASRNLEYRIARVLSDRCQRRGAGGGVRHIRR